MLISHLSTVVLQKSSLESCYHITVSDDQQDASVSWYFFRDMFKHIHSTNTAKSMKIVVIGKNVVREEGIVFHETTL